MAELYYKGSFLESYLRSFEGKRVIKGPLDHIIPSNSSFPATKKLISAQNKYFPGILKELKDNSRKIGHWIWYVFPTTKPGDSDPEKTAIDRNGGLEYLFRNSDIMAWTEILKEILSLLMTKWKEGEGKNKKNLSEKERSNALPSGVIPSIDYGRINISLNLFKDKGKVFKDKRYEEFFKVIKELRKFTWR